MKEPRKRGKGGRPREYKWEYGPIVHDLARRGDNLPAICQILRIGEATFWRWIAEYPEFKSWYESGEKLGQRVRDARMTRAAEVGLEKRAAGYEYDEVTSAPGPGGKIVEVRRVKKHIPPDPAAIKYVLSNRAPKRWPKDQQVDLGEDTLAAFLEAIHGHSGGHASAVRRAVERRGQTDDGPAVADRPDGDAADSTHADGGREGADGAEP
ncbi:MAG TPA: hypothetical protein ENN81_10190 [Phycisphaerales bacterium]|nr:hypothetical protein [Phycisphaerales bacterium]